MNSMARSIIFKNVVLTIISFVFINPYNSKVYGEIFKENSLDEIDFETALNKNSVEFHNYENPETLFDNFFGLSNSHNESEFNTNYKDLSLQIDSKNIRELYKEKLLEMKNSSKNNTEDKLNWSFFNKRI